MSRPFAIESDQALGEKTFKALLKYAKRAGRAQAEQYDRAETLSIQSANDKRDLARLQLRQILTLFRGTIARLLQPEASWAAIYWHPLIELFDNANAELAARVILDWFELPNNGYLRSKVLHISNYVDRAIDGGNKVAHPISPLDRTVEGALTIEALAFPRGENPDFAGQIFNGLLRERRTLYTESTTRWHLGRKPIGNRSSIRSTTPVQNWLPASSLCGLQRKTSTDMYTPSSHNCSITPDGSILAGDQLDIADRSIRQRRYTYSEHITFDGRNDEIYQYKDC